MRSWDTETALIQGGCLSPPPACVTWQNALDVEPEIVHAKDPAAIRILEDILCNPNVGANTAYDLAVVGANYKGLLPLVFESLDNDLSHDVIIAQKLCDIGEGCYRGKEVVEWDSDEPVFVSYRYGLSDLHNRHFGIPLEKDEWRLQYGKFRHVPLNQWPEGAKFYAKNDATATLKVWYAILEQKLRAPMDVYLKPETFQCRAAFALQLIAAWGFQTDTNEVNRFLKKLHDDQEKRRAFLQDKSVGLVAEKGSRNQKEAKKLMREVAGDKCVLTKTGLEKYRDWWAGMVKAKQKPTEEQKLREKNRLFDQGYISLSRAECLVTKDKRLIAYAEYGQHQNLISKVKRLKTGGLPIQTSFESLLETGRISSFSSRILYNSAATLNLPRKPGMRECFVPRNYEMTIPEEDRNVLLFCDFGKAELVALSENMIKLFGHSALGDVLNAGKDPYIDFASSLLNMSYEEADKKKNTEEVAEKRQLSKAWVLGKPGGLGVEKFILWAKAVYNLNLGATPEEELERVKKYDAIFFQKYPEIRKYLKWIGELCKNDPQNLCDIKHIYFGHLRGRMQYTVAANSQMQTLTAYLFKLAVWETVRRCYVGKKVGGRLKTAQFEKTYLYGQRPVAPVHDELVVESKEKIAHEAGHELKEVMEGEANKILQYVKMTSELACARRWRKGAKPVYYKGRLQPVEDASMRALFEFFGRCAKKEMKP